MLAMLLSHVVVMSTSLVSHMRGIRPSQSERLRRKELRGPRGLPEATQQWRNSKSDVAS